MSRTHVRVSKNKENPYVMLNKTAINDERLSWKAKGLHAYLMSLPDDWQIYLEELTKHAKDGIDSTSTAINELIEFGYIIREHIKNEKGQFIGYEYVVFEIPQEPSNPTAKRTSPRTGKSKTGKSRTGKSGATNKELKLNNNLTKKAHEKFDNRKNFKERDWENEDFSKYYSNLTKKE